MNQYNFTKMHGLGNNYIYVNLFEESLPEDQLSSIAISVSSQHTGIGSDGLILIGPSERADVLMRIFNNDGSEAKNCGNGLRCVAKYAYEHELVEGEEFSIETLGGIVQAQVHPEGREVHQVTINMGEPRLKRADLPMIGQGSPDDVVLKEKIEVEGHQLEMTGVSMGNPHAVFFIDEISAAPVLSVGPVLEKGENFPEGVNVEFVEIVDEKEMHFRVWERGSGVTQACGTGACAAVVAAVMNDMAQRNEEVVVHLSGGDLYVTWTESGEVLMTGPAVTICEGTYYYDGKNLKKHKDSTI
ncbi:diaminopimelate epimerase [Alkalihalobacillus sp. TS-13]|uniref:diaminopimelate epimerase n=1 Tax=Alkalihalobacillus sp. TS-13 TaxID=2842455 RepID=UPI001C86C46F|nr:diaminopimelate epimerase [Alkalihalobacillus sp. TS-13]